MPRGQGRGQAATIAILNPDLHAQWGVVHLRPAPRARTSARAGQWTQRHWATGQRTCGAMRRHVDVQTRTPESPKPAPMLSPVSPRVGPSCTDAPGSAPSICHRPEPSAAISCAVPWPAVRLRALGQWRRRAERWSRMSPSLTICVVNHQGRDVLPATLAAVCAQRRPRSRSCWSTTRRPTAAGLCPGAVPGQSGSSSSRQIAAPARRARRGCGPPAPTWWALSTMTWRPSPTAFACSPRR